MSKSRKVWARMLSRLSVRYEAQLYVGMMTEITGMTQGGARSLCAGSAAVKLSRRVPCPHRRRPLDVGWLRDGTRPDHRPRRRHVARARAVGAGRPLASPGCAHGTRELGDAALDGPRAHAPRMVLAHDRPEPGRPRRLRVPAARARPV